MRRTLAALTLLTACPSQATQVDPGPEEKPPQLEAPADVERDPLCYKAAGITEASLEGTAHASAYNPERFMAECQANVDGEQGEAWKTYYLCIVTWQKVTPDCAKLSPPPPGLSAPAPTR
jgi:hypothetical protein